MSNRSRICAALSRPVRRSTVTPARERDVRTERSFFPLNTNALQPIHDHFLHSYDRFGSGFHTEPEHPRRTMRWERTDSAELEPERRMRNGVTHDLDNPAGAIVRDFANENQRDVQLTALRPSEGGAAHRLGQTPLLVGDPLLRTGADLDRSEESSHPGASTAACSWLLAPIET